MKDGQREKEGCNEGVCVNTSEREGGWIGRDRYDYMGIGMERDWERAS